MTQDMDEFLNRLNRHLDELRWLYMELYDNGSMFAELCSQMEAFYKERGAELKKRDREKLETPDWFQKQDMLGMMLYIDNFAGDLKGVKKKLSYLQECGVTCLHLMPFLDTPEGRSDGGYAVSDFRKVRPDLGTMEDLEALSRACHKKGINLCMDFVMNHTSEDHEWAKRARQGDGEYMSRYFFYDNGEIPARYEQTVPQVFPTTAPGNFTWVEEAGHYVLTTFYPYQWDLNYKNPRVFNEMMYHFLYLANRGLDIIRIDAVPYIWKELGTSCRNLPQVHTIVRMMRMIGEIVCPSVALLGEVVMEPQKVVPYFGTTEKPECHLLYNVTTMATIWHTVASQNTELLKRQLSAVYSLPDVYTFLNYLRCHDDIGWGLDYDFLKQQGMREIPHKRFLNEYFQGNYGESRSRGELYNDDPVTMDARFCGTTASMCGMEAAAEDGREEMERALRLDLMLHALMLWQPGIPMLYSGDEVGQLNDPSYKQDPKKAGDSRYLHRGRFPWKLAEEAQKNKDSIPGRLFDGLRRLEEFRSQEAVMAKDAQCRVLELENPHILCLQREKDGQKLTGVFNFSSDSQKVFRKDLEGSTDCFGGKKETAAEIWMEPYGFRIVKQI